MPQADDDGTIARLLLVKALPLFADVAADELAVVAEHAHPCGFRAGETVLGGAGGTVDAIHLVLEGRVTEHRHGKRFRTYGPQRVLGGVDALAQSTAGVHVVADEDCRTLALERSALRAILEDSFGILSAALGGIAAATLRLRRALAAGAFDAGPGDEHPWADGLGARIAALGRDPRLAGARVRTLGQLAHDADVAVVRRGDRLWSAGESAEHGYLLVRGRVEGTTASGEPFTSGVETMIGLEEALALEPRWYDLTAATDTTLLAIDRAVLIDALEDDSDSAVTVLGAMAAVASGLRDRVAAGAAS